MTSHSKQPAQFTIGLGWWNIYFIAKVALFLQGIIDFHPLENFALLLFILLPVPVRALNVLRHVISVIIAAWLLHYDSFLPPLERLWAQAGQLMQFEFSYLVELMGRFISVQALLGLFALCAAYFILSKFLRVSVFVVIAMIYVSIPKTPQGSVTVETTQPAPPATTEVAKTTQPQVTEINEESLNSMTADFFAKEASRRVSFSPDSAQDAPFDLLFLSICSVAWDDIEIAGMADHPLFKEFDVMFDNFSAATSYSGPAVVRLLRASCGQQEHSKLFEPAPKQCYLFDNLKDLGFNENLLMNHNGVFDSFLELIKKDGDLKTNLMSQEGFKPYQKSFDGSSIFRDKQVLDDWWQQRIKSDDEKVVALYNTISLHDGNRIINANSTTSMVSYKKRLKNLLDDLYSFFQELKASKRNIVVALVPEHGAGMRGDRMQISGMREIPAPTIVHTPVGIKVFGEGIQRQGDTKHVKAPSSYLALSQLVSNILEQNIYEKKSFSPDELAGNLPETQVVAQNSGSTVIEVNGKYYVSLDGSSWIEYPK
ncbi:Cellulose biosynthesis protein BcsG [Vibrio sp. B1ASS3]|uniref:cellulose biosynthesis protein BcsG n=1 Tax=Vibrio sp. B1ASS3 TaxID=2751176 RepID=UPI001ABB0BC1|nr:cellulose biosynthesis protein BcsG [Vibrio sp. B1ASS3]CAD7814288.1 Cellulose biosynthesis protein BcsG [Vibrio sp. B1ASS3]CAE6922076.1 Cellulose biosynthesis protein BcsG [Vibrio sp. B1ASS3]